MNEQPSPCERAEALERSSARRWSSALTRPLPLVGLIFALALLVTNLLLAARLLKQKSNVAREHSFWVLCQPGGTVAERTEAFRHLISEGNKEWRSARLSELNLERISLPGADLKGADFRRTSLANANLDAAKLGKASLEMSNLSGAELSAADLSEVNLYRGVLRKARLHRASLRAAVLQEIKAQVSDFLAADLSDADCLMADFTGANLAGANFSGARLEATIFKDANLSLARLKDANLKDADFTNSNWWRARGLTSAQIAFLKEKFTPTSGTNPLSEDFQKWATQTGN